MKLALEEWQHWLEGSKYSVVVWTDPKNVLICWCIDLGDREDRVRRSAAGGRPWYRPGGQAVCFCIGSE